MNENRFHNLALRIKDVNVEAAAWLINLLPKDCDKMANSIFGRQDDNDLFIAFIWRETPQGHDYWREIHITIHEQGFNEEFDDEDDEDEEW